MAGSGAESSSRGFTRTAAVTLAAGLSLPLLAGQRPRATAHRGARQRPRLRGRTAVRRLELLAGPPAGPGPALRLVVDRGRLPDLGRRLGGVRLLRGRAGPGRADPVPRRPRLRRLRRPGGRRPAAVPPGQRHRLVALARWPRQPGDRGLPAGDQRRLGPRPDPGRDDADLHARRRPGLPARRRRGLLDRARALRRAPGHPADGLGPAQPRAAGAVARRQRVRRPQLPRTVHARRGARRRLVRRVRADRARGGGPARRTAASRTWSRPGRHPG